MFTSFYIMFKTTRGFKLEQKTYKNFFKLNFLIYVALVIITEPILYAQNIKMPFIMVGFIFGSSFAYVQVYPFMFLARTWMCLNFPDEVRYELSKKKLYKLYILNKKEFYIGLKFFHIGISFWLVNTIVFSLLMHKRLYVK